MGPPDAADRRRRFEALFAASYAPVVECFDPTALFKAAYRAGDVREDGMVDVGAQVVPLGKGAGIAGRKGFPWGDRCWSCCPLTHSALRYADGRVRCLPRRTTRVVYGLKLSARYHFPWGDVTGTSTSDRSWSFRPDNEAIWLCRQCTMRSAHEDRRRIRYLVTPLMPCKRLEITLEHQRCKRQSPPARCDAWR